jgi:hypothetical protein
MTEFAFLIPVAIYFIAGTIMLILIGLFEREQRHAIQTFFGLLLHPFLLINRSLESFWHGVRIFFRGQFTVEGRLDTQSVFYQFIGATLYTLFFAAFNFAEFHLLALSLVAAGIDVGHYSAPMGAGTLTAFAILASILFWGAVICDLIGITKTAPWREALKKKGREYLLYITFFALALSLFVTVTMGLFRGRVIAEENSNPTGLEFPLSGGISDFNTETILKDYGFPTNSNTDEGLYYWIPIIANIGIPVLVLVGGIFSSWGLVTMIKFIMLIAGFFIISPLGLLLISTSLVTNIVERLYQFIEACLQLLGAMGRWFMGLFGWEEPNPPQCRNPDPDGDSQSSDEAFEEDPDTRQDQEVSTPPLEGWNPYRQ